MRAPVYYIAHGGPPSMFDGASGPFKGWAALGARIRAEMDEGRIRGLLCVSAHWEAEGEDRVLVNAETSNPLIYDFRGFGAAARETFKSSGSPGLAERVVEVLGSAHPPIRAGTTSRGLDHGLWVPFKIMFGQIPAIATGVSQAEREGAWKGPPPPIVQLSMDPRGTVEGNAELGRALGALRDEGYAIVATGQPVHNLRALFSPAHTPNPAQSAAFDSFFSALLDATTSRGPSARSASAPTRASALQDVAALIRHPAYKLAHPTDEHFMPLVIAAGAAAAGPDGVAGKPAEVVFKEAQGALGWAFFRWE